MYYFFVVVGCFHTALFTSEPEIVNKTTCVLSRGVTIHRYGSIYRYDV